MAFAAATRLRACPILDRRRRASEATDRTEQSAMQIRVGFEMTYACPQPTPMLLVLNVHHSRASDLVRPDLVVTTPAVPLVAYRDLFGNWCSRIVAPAGRIVISTEAVVNDSGLPD